MSKLIEATRTFFSHILLFGGIVLTFWLPANLMINETVKGASRWSIVPIADVIPQPPQPVLTAVFARAV